MTLPFVIFLLVIVGLFVVALGYNAATEPKRKAAEAAQAAALAAQMAETIKKGAIAVGMTREQVVASWGEPDRKNITGGANVDREQWIYERYATYIYFNRGRLTTWQQQK